jgi:hypothetical protein
MDKYFSDTDTDTDDNPTIKPKSLQNKQFNKHQKVKKYKFGKKMTWCGIILVVLLIIALVVLFKNFFKRGPPCNN